MTLNICHLPYNQGSLASGLVAGEIESGVKSVLYSEPNLFAQMPIAHAYSLLGTGWQRFQAFKKARKSDVVMFNYGSSLFDPPYRKHFYLDLPYYPKRVKTGMIFQGSDIRIHYPEYVSESRAYELSLGAVLGQETRDGIISADEKALKLFRAEKAGRYVDRLFFVNPDLSAALPSSARFMPYPLLRAGPGRKEIEPTLAGQNRPLRVLHMATNRVLKGTGLIERALEQVRANSDVEAKVLVKVSREEAMAALHWADILIDQMCLGWYGMQAAEALAQGKPVICWIDQAHWAKYLPEWDGEMSGLINVSHMQLAKTIVELVENPDQVRAQSIAGRTFAAAVHDPVRVVQAAYGDWLRG